MSATSDAFSPKDSSSKGMNNENGRPEPITESSSGSDQGLDSSLHPHVSDEGGAESPAPAETIAEPSTTDDGTTFSASEATSLSEFPVVEQPLFEGYEYVPPPPPPRRKPDFADCLLFALLAIAAFFCSSLLEYLADPLELVRLAVDRLAPSGTLAVSVPETRSPLQIFPRAYQRLWRNRLSPRDYQRAGLRLVCRFGFAFLPSFLAPLALLELRK